MKHNWDCPAPKDVASCLMIIRSRVKELLSHANKEFPAAPALLIEINGAADRIEELMGIPKK